MHVKNSNIGHYVQTSQLNSSISVMPIDFYHSLPHSVTLTFAGGHKLSMKQNLTVSLSHTFSTEWDEIGHDDEAIQA